MFDSAIAWLTENADLLGGLGTLFALATFLVTNGRALWQRSRGDKTPGLSVVPYSGSNGDYPMVDAPPPSPDYGGRTGVAVLPFKELGAVPEHFTDGLIEDLIADLQKAGFATPGRTALQRLLDDGADAHRIARDLGVAYVIEGSVRMQDQKFRVAAQMMDHSAAILWSDRFNVAGDDLMAMQESLAGKIAEGIASQHKGPLKAATADAPAAYRTQAEALAARRLSWSPKSRLVALILCFMVGVFGVHRFYIGRWFTGIIYLLTLGLFGIGWLMDMILIPLGALTDGRNRPIRVWLPDDAPQTA